MKRALIVGGSLGGLMIGTLLRRCGWSVDIFERVEADLADRGGGIITDARLWAAMAEAGIDVTQPQGVRLTRRVVFAADGSVIAEREIEQIVTSWDALYRLLRATIPDAHYHRGQAVTGITQDGATASVHFDDAPADTADLVVAADGAGSTIRGALLSDVEPGYANYVAWRGLVDERDLDPLARAALDGTFSFCQPDGEQMLSYTILGPDGEDGEGERRHNFVWYRPAEPERALPDLLTGEDGHVFEGSIPPPKIRAEIIAQMRADADRLLSPAYAGLVRATEHPFIQPIYDHVAPRLAFGRVVLTGDAAAQARPHVGAGTTKAFADALALRDALRDHDDVPAALMAFEEARLAPSRAMVEHGRWLGRHIDPLHRVEGGLSATDELIEQAARYDADAVSTG